VAANRDAARALISKYRDGSATSRALSMAFTHSRVTLQHLGVTDDFAMLSARMASRVFGLDASCSSPEALARNTLAQSNSVGYGISGDLPIVVIRIGNVDALPLVRQVLFAQEYWRVQGLRADVVILNEHAADYLDELQAQLTALLAEGRWAAWKDKPGGAFLLRTDGMGQADRDLFAAAARVVLVDELGSLDLQMARPDALAVRRARRHSARRVQEAGTGRHTDRTPAPRARQWSRWVYSRRPRLRRRARRRSRNTVALVECHGES
jgi:cyclic beta-1,2-glucan synthetase